MTKGDWLDLTVLERRKYNLLVETMDLSQQLGEAMDRGDDVSVRLLVAMRQEPILGLEKSRRPSKTGWAACPRRSGSVRWPWPAEPPRRGRERPST